MKTSYLQRTEISFDEPTRIIPSDTSHEHLQRVEEWTQKSTTAPPSNKKRSAKDHENLDLEAKSQLIAEAVQLLDSRDKQTRSKTSNDNNRNHPFDIDSDDGDNEEESQYYSIGNHFRNSKLSARNYVKHFESKMKRKKARQEAIANTYPSIRSRKNLLKRLSTMHPLAEPNSADPVVEPDSWRFKASKSVKFSVKSGSQQNLSQRPSDEGSENGEKWEMKQENDRDWWKWKLKQRFLQNDELLHKLASQRKKLESSLVRGENNRINRNLIFNNKKASPTSTTHQQQAPQMLPSGRNSSWHVSVEIPSHMALSMSSKRVTASKIKTAYQAKSRDPMPNFYTPSKQLVTAITNPFTGDDLAKDPETSANQKLKVLKKDPYLSKLLAGKEMFRPEMMLEGNQQMSQEYKSTGGGENTRRKLSLESLTDTDDELTATKFFNPDVKVLYERLSEMEMMNSRNLADKSRIAEGVFMNSREPSDGFLNLPILLETGRFNRYNKLPSMKPLTTTNNNASKQQTKRSERSYTRPQSKSKRSNNLTSMKLVSTPIVGGASAGLPVAEANANSANQQGKIENLPTNEWAKKVMQKVKKQDNSTKTEDGGYLDDAKKRSEEFKDILTVQQNKYKVPVDQETNLLYHEILMSKWKKDKHNKEKENDVGGKNNKHSANSKWKRVEHGHDGKNIANVDWSRPKGLDIWLENIREKAKRDRLISPLPNNGDVWKGIPPLTS